jgi:MtaA/CmuA family methyltransferase
MNGYQRIQAALRGERPDRIPIMLHDFMMAARRRGVTMREFRSNPRAIVESFAASVEEYDLDGVVVDIDTATLAGAAGVSIDFPEDEPARCARPRLESLEAAADLEPVDVRSYPGAQVWLEAVTLLRAHFGDEVMIRGNCDQCPFSLAGMLRGPAPWMLDLCDEDRRELVFKLLDYASGVTAQFIHLMAEAGAHMLSNGDSPAGPELISPAMYREFAFPYERRIVQYAHGHGLPYVLHICGNTAPILDDMAATGADGIELDQRTDAARARRALEDKAAFFGNIDPSNVLARGTPALVAEKTRALLEIFAGNHRFVLNAGCAIPPATPPENIRAMVDAARSFAPRAFAPPPRFNAEGEQTPA